MGSMDYSPEQYRILKFLILKIFNIKGKRAKISRRAVHKIIFKITQEATNENFKKAAPFYWYKYGPFSELVETALDDLLLSEALTEVRVSEDTTLLALTDMGKELCIKMYEELGRDMIPESEIKILKNMVRKANLFKFDKYIKEIYDNYAPYRFMNIYKFGFLPTFEKYVHCRVVEGQSFLFPKQEIEEIEYLLYECEANLPKDRLFKSFNESFSNYTTTLSRCLEAEKSYENLSIALELAKDIWLTFAGGVRIFAHDEYYKNKIVYWRDQFLIDCLSLNQKIMKFSDMVMKNWKPQSIKVSEREKKILSAAFMDYAL